MIGRAKEIETTIEVLARRKKNNPVLIGEPGVGKTAIVEGLAQRIVAGEVPESLRDKRLVELSVNAMVAGSKYRGEFEERVQQILKEVTAEQDRMVLFIDEIHTIVGAGQGGGEGGLDIANTFKPALARGELNLIGATTLNEYQKHIEKDAALERRFQPVLVPEPTVAQTIMILRGLRDTLEAHHKVAITDEAIIAAAELSDRYVTGRFLPDKAIDLIDQAAARVKISATARPVDVQDLEAEVRQLKRETDYASSRKNFERSKDLQAQHDAKAKELRDGAGALAARARLGLGRGAQRAHRPGGVEAHRHPGDRADERGARAPDQDGGTAAPARHRAGRGRQGGERRRAPGARRACARAAGRSPPSCSSARPASARPSSQRRLPRWSMATRTP